MGMKFYTNQLLNQRIIGFQHHDTWTEFLLLNGSLTIPHLLMKNDDEWVEGVLRPCFSDEQMFFNWYALVHE